MRNRHPGDCYRCGLWVQAGEGHFERFRGGWRTQHAACAIEHRGTADPARASHQQADREARAKGTGRPAQRARRALRDLAQGAEQ